MYILVPLIAWLISGSVKFSINYIKFGKEAKNRIGNGGFPSTHTTIMVTITGLTWLVKGTNSIELGIAASITMIIIIDALGIRKALGEHAQVVNMLVHDRNLLFKKLRESQGHTRVEVLGGLILGIVLAYMIHFSIIYFFISSP